MTKVKNNQIGLDVLANDSNHVPEESIDTSVPMKTIDMNEDPPASSISSPQNNSVYYKLAQICRTVEEKQVATSNRYREEQMDAIDASSVLFLCLSRKVGHFDVNELLSIFQNPKIRSVMLENRYQQLQNAHHACPPW